MSHSPAKDVLEEIDDTSDLLSKPLHQFPLVQPPASAQSAQHTRRYPPGFAVSTTSSSKSNGRHQQQPPSGSRIWQPPPIAASNPSSAHHAPIIGGSGARVPTQFLDSAGGFAKQPKSETAHDGSAKSEPYTTTIQQSLPGTFPDTKPVHLESRSAGPAKASSSRDAIDLTLSDDEDANFISDKADSADGGFSSTNVKVDEDDDDDEPVMVSHKMPSPVEVQIDHAKTDAIVCAGMVQASVLCMYGLPPSLMYDTIRGDSPPQDPAYTKENWPSMTRFGLEHLTRPVILTLANPQPLQPQAQHGSWNYLASAPASAKADINVSALVAPLAAHPHLPRAQAIAMGHYLTVPFGSLADKYANAMEPLLRQNKVRFEARCPMLINRRVSTFLHTVELLVFSRRSDLVLVTDRLTSSGIMLFKPANYYPEDYPTAPPYFNPHLSRFSGLKTDPVHSTYSGIYRGSGTGTSVHDKELSEQEKRKQVDMIYSSIKSGEELAAVEPKPPVSTKLMSHQKQALGFLLDRERDRRWSELLKDKEPTMSNATAEPETKAKVESGQFTSQQPSSLATAKQEESNGRLTDVNGTQTKEKAKGEEDSISLWKIKKGLDGNIRGWRNIITKREALTQPRICRGSILADDMGLGKTITTIALIAHSLKEAKIFGSQPVQKDLAIERAQQIQATTKEADQFRLEHDESDQDSDGSVTLPYTHVHGAPPNASTGASSRNKKKKKVDPEILRRKHVAHRSRATLIVCPLSVVSNWEDQFKEHWDGTKQPLIYLYHGPSRITDPKRLANFDIVITTYQTLGYEFSKQTTWVAEDGGKPDKKSKVADDDSDDDVDDDDEFLMVDGNGEPLRRDKKGKKRKRKSAKEAANTLQRIEWFRIVLDEAHYIKGASTWQSKAVCNLSSQRRLCLTGTPIQNSIDDLFALLRFLRLDPFTDRATWNEFCGHREATGLSAKTKENDPIDSANVGHVQIVMKFLALRRQKTSKTADGKDLLTLPPKLSKTEYLEFDEVEKARYQALHQLYKEEFEEMMVKDTVNNNYATILHEILNLRMTCDHPSLVDASKDAKRKERGADLFGAIEQDGLSRERAAMLFTLFRESEMAYCNECQADLSGGADLEPGREADALANALDEAVANPDGRGKGKKARNSTVSTPLNASGSGMDSPSDPSTDVQPVVTRCQHVFCSACFAKSIGSPWPCSSALEYARCPACTQSLQLIIDAIQLQPADFFDLNEDQAEDDFDNNSNGRTNVKDDDPFDYGSDAETKLALPLREKSKRRNGKAAVKGETAVNTEATVKGEAGVKGEDDEEADVVPVAGDDWTKGRKDLSTKIKALITDLIPFSQCNPHSRLFDPMAPQLLHVDTSKSEDAEVKASEDPVVVIQRPPPAVRGANFLSDFDLAVNSFTPYEPIKSVIFSQWTKMLDRIQKSLKMTGIRFTRLDGSMRRLDRSAALETFRTDPGVEVLLVSLRAGGTGLNLVSACRAYLMDPYWNPAVENQGLDRIHRMGQTQPVITTKYVMKHSIEENMLRLQKRKMMLAETVGNRRQIGATGAGGAQKRKEDRREELKILFGTSNGGIPDVS